MSDNQENPMGNNPETTPKWPLDEHSYEKFQPQHIVPLGRRELELRDENENDSDNQENPMGNNPETSLLWPDGFNENYPEWFEPQRPEPSEPRRWGCWKE